MQMDIIGFDACLMSMYEVASILSPFSKTLLGSELLEPGHGWDYSVPLKGITQRRDAGGNQISAAIGASTQQLGELIIRGYMNQVCLLSWRTS